MNPYLAGVGLGLVLLYAAPGWVLLRRLWRAFNPQLVILLETELWPNLVAAADTRKVPVVLVNGRRVAVDCFSKGFV